jgi:MerC mercury resistance protein
MHENASHAMHRSWLDSLGAAVSLACAIQCLFFPLLSGVLPLLGLGFLLGDGIERGFLAVSLVLAVGSFGLGFRIHRCFHVFIFLVSASASILAARLWVDPSYEVPLVVSGTLVLVAGHLFNRRLCRLCAACNSDESNGALIDRQVATGRKEQES